MSALRYTLISTAQEFMAEQAQWPAFHTLHQQLRPAMQDFDQYHQQIILILQERAQFLAVRDEEGRLVALALFRMHHNTYQNKLFFLEDFVVDETIRASGVGAQVLDYLENYAREQGCAYLSLDSGTFRTRAHKFYYMNNYIADCFHFSKKL